MNNVKVEKITAPNGSVFTGAGTNTYLVGENDISIVDPGPNIKSHLDKIIKKYGSMSKMFIRGSNENRAIIKIQEKE